jgi:hypothetical protein
MRRTSRSAMRASSKNASAPALAKPAITAPPITGLGNGSCNRKLSGG